MPLNTERELVSDFLVSLDGIGTRAATRLIQTFPTLNTFLQATATDISALPWVTEDKAQEIVEKRDEVFDVTVNFGVNRMRWIIRKVENSFYRFLHSKQQHILTLNLDVLIPNPYMIFILKDSYGLDNVNDLVDFMISQHIERSMVTSFGTLIEEIARCFADGKGNARHVDLIKITSDNRAFGVSVKSGPNTINAPDVQDISNSLNSWRNNYRERNPEMIVLTVLGLTYGNNPSPLALEFPRRGHQLSYGKEFWEFISEEVVPNPTETYLLIRDAAEKAVERFGKNQIRDAVSYVSIQIKHAFIQGFCDNSGRINWNQILENNM